MAAPTRPVLQTNFRCAPLYVATYTVFPLLAATTCCGMGRVSHISIYASLGQGKPDCGPPLHGGCVRVKVMAPKIGEVD
jgi:hypothetical protein